MHRKMERIVGGISDMPPPSSRSRRPILKIAHTFDHTESEKMALLQRKRLRHVTRTSAGFSARRERRMELPDVHESDDREWDGEAERNRPDISRADGHGEEIHESVSGLWSERFL